MKTLGNVYLEKIESLAGSVNLLVRSDYSSQNLSNLLVKAGVETELFLKFTVFPSCSSREKFVSLIDRLLACNIDYQKVDSIHAFRKKYNEAKHDPSIQISIIDTQRLLGGLIDAMKIVVARQLGNCNLPFSVPLRRLVWIAACDHYIGGDTEVHIIFPVESMHYLGPPTVDIIYIDMLDWDDVKSELASIGTLVDSNGQIPQEQYKSFLSEEGFLGALVFDGDYKDIIKVLARHERRNDLLPFLLRKSNYRSMLIAVAMASVDISRTGNVDKLELKVSISRQAASVYAVPNDYRLLDKLCESFASMIVELVPDSKYLSGPSWIGKTAFDESKNSARFYSSEFGYFVDHDLVIRME